jgi:hypothetical protein
MAMAPEGSRKKPESKEETRAGGGEAEPGIEPFSDTPDVPLVIAREYYAYQTTLNHIQGEANSRFEQAAQRFRTSVEQQQEEVNRRIAEAYQAYSSSFQRHEIDREEVPWEAVEQAYKAYLKTHQTAQAEAQAAFEGARAAYDRAIDSVGKEAGTRRADAFHAFVATLKETLGAIDSNAMSSGRLASIAQTLFAAAMCGEVG